jgi:hemolysin activation/secretion protein
VKRLLPGNQSNGKQESQTMKTYYRLTGIAVLLTALTGAPALGGITANNAGSAVVVPELKGLVFINKPADFNTAGVNGSGIDVSRVPMLNAEEFRKELAGYLNHSLTFDQLNAITHSVVDRFREHNHPLVDAVAPQQNVQSGVIQIVVTEFRVGDVRAQGNRWFSDRLITSSFTLQHGDIVDSSQLINQLDAANTNPFRRVNLVYEPSAEPGYTDLVLQTQDRLPIRVFSGFDNSGTPVTGRSRWDMGATWGNALWHDQQITYQFSSSDDFFSGRSAQAGEPSGASFVGQSLNWSIPVFGRDSITLLADYERSVPNIGQDFGLVGRSGQASFRYNHALARTQSLVHGFQFGYDFKVTNNNLAFGGTQVSRNNAQIDQFSGGYTANLTDKLGSTSLATTLFYSPSNLTGDNTTAAFQPAVGQSGRSLASARYVYWRSDLNRLTKLPGNAVWSLRVLGQAANANLLYTEELGGGGSEILRGYDPNSVLGDTGFITSNELRSPALRKAGEVKLGQVQLLTFWDYGHLTAANASPNAVNHINASSVGAGLRYNIRSNVTARFDYGWQLQHLPGADSRDELANFGVVFAY